MLNVFKFLKRNKWKSLYFFVLLFLALFLKIFDWTHPLPVLPTFSKVVYASDTTILQAFLTPDEKWRLKSEPNEVNERLKNAFLIKEDNSFYAHPGVNPIAVARAVFNNVVQGKRTSGASTITMQVARMLEPKDRTVSNKLYEMCRAWQLERQFTKEQILQLYVNMVPYGGNIEGVKSASLLYFDKTPQQLSPAEITTLTIIPNRPSSLRLKANNSKLVRERNRWLRKFEEEGVFSKKETELALKEPFDVERQTLKNLAPHFCQRILNKNKTDVNIITSLESHYQAIVQRITSQYIKKVQKYNINNLAVVVLDNRTRRVIAYQGSQNFNDNENSGQVNGCKAVRSPGSTLKPLVYAMGFDKGIITPKTKLSDVPTDFGDYSPENFNRKFNGKIAVDEALAFSLNVPAVKVLDDIGVQPFVKKLCKMNFKQINQDQYKLGLSVILGGCGVSLEELASMYATFANQGEYLPLNWTALPNNDKPVKIISPAASYLITDILTKPERPDFPNNYQSSYHIPKVGWKTGTSYGRRDAWSVGFNEKYTIAVWLGNFSGEGVRELTGANVATPLLFELFNTIDYNSSNSWFKKPKTVGVRYVCNETGKVPNHFCENQLIDSYIENISSTVPCEHLKKVWVSDDNKYSYCTSCLPEGGYHEKLYPNHEAEVISFFEQQEIGYEKIPEHYPSCSRIFHDHNPKIISPMADKEYIVDRVEPAELLLKCQAHNDVMKIYWYIDDVFYREAERNEDVFWKPSAGEHKISVSDDKGRSYSAQIKVSWE